MTTDSEDQAKISLRDTAARAYAFVKGNETIEGFAAFTFEEALQKQLDLLEGKDGTRSAVGQVEKLQSDLTAVVDGLKEVADAVADRAEVPDEENVNTQE
jgi:hypothetical protein